MGKAPNVKNGHYKLFLLEMVHLLVSLKCMRRELLGHDCEVIDYVNSMSNILSESYPTVDGIFHTCNR